MAGTEGMTGSETVMGLVLKTYTGYWNVGESRQNQGYSPCNILGGKMWKMCKVNKIAEGMFIHNYLPTFVCFVSFWLDLFFYKKKKKHNYLLKSLEPFLGWSGQVGNCSGLLLQWFYIIQAGFRTLLCLKMVEKGVSLGPCFLHFPCLQMPFSVAKCCLFF